MCIISAVEIAQLNLQNVQLVHLSACEIGLGKSHQKAYLVFSVDSACPRGRGETACR